MTIAAATANDGFSLQTLLELCSACAGIMLFALYAMHIGITQNSVIALWPAAGVAVWSFWRHSILALPGALFAFLLVATSVNGTHQIFAALGNVTGAMAAGALLRRVIVPGAERPVHDIAWIAIGAAALSAFVSVLFGVPELSLILGLTVSEIPEIALRWFMSAFVGAAIATPPLLIWSQQAARRRPHFGSTELIVTAATCVGMVVVTQQQQLPLLSVPGSLLLVCLPGMFWLAMRESTLEAVLGLSLIGSCNLTFATQVLAGESLGMLEMQLFVLSFLLVALLLQAATRHRVLLLDKLRQESAGLELRVQERTREAEVARAQAEAADQSKSEFLANTSHEVRTPLNAILGMAEFLREGSLDQGQQQQVDTILSSGRHLMSLLNDIIDLSKVEAGKLEIVVAPRRPEAMLEQLASLWRPMATEKGISFEIHLRDALPAYLELDDLRLLQCLSNLVSNAIKFTREGRVTVRVCREPRSDGDFDLVFAVSDTGMGMSAAEQARLFQPFVQADASISRSFGGTGLGLSITRRLAELMGGSVAVESSRGEGTTFALRIRTRAAQGKPDRPSATAPSERDRAKLRGLRVLLVEDNKVNRMVARGHLASYGMHFTEAEDGAQAMARLTAEAFDLVLLDIHMPVMDGVAAIAKIRASQAPVRDLPVIALTANAMAEERDRLLHLGMDGYASKPIDREALVAEIVRVLALRPAKTSR